MIGRYTGTLHPFQAEGVARAYVIGDTLCTFETGLGKTHLSMGLAAILLEDAAIDRVVILAEANKILDWEEELGQWTDLSVGLYHGPKRANALPCEVVVSTYETFLRDAVASRRLTPMGESLLGQRLLIVLDESVVKLRNRTSSAYASMEVLLRELRKAASIRTLHLTATPIESSPENTFNLLRLISPRTMTVEQFERRYVLYRDEFGRARKFRNLGPNDHYDPSIPSFRDVLAPHLIHKAKTDPDISHLFPKISEAFVHVPMGDRQGEFYDTVADMFDKDDRSAFLILRLIAGAPESLLASDSKAALEITGTLGAASLKAIGSAKIREAVERLRVATEGGESAVVFTFFGQTVLPILQRELEAAGITVFVNHGKMTAKNRKDSERKFRSTPGSVFLSSDAGARGLNLPEATYLLNFEMPLTHANYIQRINRISRINSKAPRVGVESLIVSDTIEEAIVRLFHDRNDWHDTLLDDDSDGSSWVTSDARRVLVSWGRSNRLRVAS